MGFRMRLLTYSLMWLCNAFMPLLSGIYSDLRTYIIGSLHSFRPSAWAGE